MVAGDVTPASGEQIGAVPLLVSSNSTVSDDFGSLTSSPENYTGELICLKVKDVLGITPVCGVHTFVYTPYVTFENLIKDVGNKFQISFDEFELVYQSKRDLYELTQMPPGETLSAADIIPTRDKEYSVTINSKKRGRRAKGGRGVARKLEDAFEACADDRIQQTSHVSESTATSDNTSLDTTTSITMRRDFVGLKNMNMTCYLNSLLQGLWFTPEFRNLVYIYIHKPDKCTKKSICVPLQKLFLRLQFSVRESIETDELTNTFGWNSRDTWHQHDIEELCNLLMENLSMEFKGTPIEGMIESLFFGTFNDYVKCMECQRRNMRDAAFLVLPLPIRQIGSPLENPTLEEALKTFTTPELLEGTNQYNCSQCDKPCDALKGFLFKMLPYILTIQLKRFEYNWNTGRRYKLNDRIVFPMVLDMNPYMDKNSEGLTPCTDFKSELVKPRNLSTPRSGHSRSLITLESKPTPEQNCNSGSEGLDIGSSPQAIQDCLEKVLQSSGPDVYQLYAVLVHRGGLTGGHYFAYIRDFESLSWYRCDDAYVRKADPEDIEISFGGDEEDKEPTSAYMLMYRRYDPEMNALPFLFEEMPGHIQEIWFSMVEAEKRSHEQEELEKNTITISVHYRVRGTWEMVQGEMNIPKCSTTADAAVLLYQRFFPEAPEISMDRLRLSRYDKDLGIIESSFDGKDDQYLTYSLRNPLPTANNSGLILEVRDQDETFCTYLPTDLVFVTQLVHFKNEDLRRVEEIHASVDSTVADLKETIATKLRVAKDTLVVILHTSGQTADALEVDCSVLRDLSLSKINYIFVESVPDEDIHSLVTFVSNYIQTVVFELEINLPLQQVDVAETLFLSKKNDEMLELNTPILSDKGPDENSSSIQNAANKIESAKSNQSDMTSISASTMIDSKSNEAGKICLSPVKSDSSRKFIFKVKDERRCHQCIQCVVRADGRMPLSLFSFNVSQMINVAEKDFIIYKVEKEEESELLYLSLCLTKITPFDKLRVRMGHRLQKDEGRVSVYYLDLNSPAENQSVVGEVALSLNNTVEEAKRLVLEHCRENLGGIELENVRLRKRNQRTPSKVFRDLGKVSDYYNLTSIHGGELYIQKLETGQSLGNSCFPIMIRRWRQKDFVLNRPYEIIIHHDHSVNIERVILDKLLEFIDVPENDIEVAKPDIGYPYEMNAVAIQDLGWFSLTYSDKKPLYVYNDELVLFVRDKTEEVKTISIEEETQLRMENEKSASNDLTNTYGLSPPKKETGLRINLACSPP